MARSARHAPIIAAGLIVLALAASLTPAAYSSDTGVWDARERGCYCHESIPSANVGFTVEGLPGRYVANGSYTVYLNVTLTDVFPKQNASQGGFYLEATAGSLFAPPGWEDRLQIRERQSTHTQLGTRARQWEVGWRAPATEGEVVTFYIFVNTVNGDRSDGFSQDHWTLRTVRIGVGDQPEIAGPPPASPPIALETYFLVPLAIGAALVSLYFFLSVRRSKPPPSN